MIVDLHSHYAMHLLPKAEGTAIDLFSTAKGRARLRDRVRAWLVGLASRFANYRSFESGPRVTVPQLREGGVGVALSVVYSFFDELDLDAPYGAPPEAGYLPRLMGQLDMVEAEIAERHGGEAAVARDPAALDRALAERSSRARALRRGRLPPRRDTGGRRPRGDRARPPRRRLHHRSRTCSGGRWRRTPRRCRFCPTGSTGWSSRSRRSA